MNIIRYIELLLPGTPIRLDGIFSCDTFTAAQHTERVRISDKAWGWNHDTAWTLSWFFMFKYILMNSSLSRLIVCAYE